MFHVKQSCALLMKRAIGVLALISSLVWAVPSSAQDVEPQIDLDNCTVRTLNLSPSTSGAAKCRKDGKCLGLLTCANIPLPGEEGFQTCSVTLSIDKKNGFRSDGTLTCFPQREGFVPPPPGPPPINQTFCFPPGLTYGMEGCPPFPPGKNKGSKE